MPHSSLEDNSSMSEALQNFPYQPLEPGQVRLLTIDTTQATDHEGLIQCSLDHYSISDPTPSTTDTRFEWGDYIAVSYTWGWDAQNPSRLIKIDGHRCRVTESLEAALSALHSSKTTTTAHVKVWVDALCINQTNPEEVRGEILRMKEIYGQAAYVYAHLGPATEDSNLGFQLLGILSQSLNQSVEEVNRELVNRRFSATDLEKKAYRAMLRIMHRPYWRRVWVLQELAMSRGSIIIACGTMEMTLEQLLPVSRFVSLNENIHLLLAIEEPDTEELFTMHLACHMYIVTWAVREQKQRILQRIATESRAKYLDLRQPLLILAQSAQASKTHDNVYGLLGLMPDSIRQSMSAYINYDLPIPVVFTAFSRAIIECTGDLDVIFAKDFRQDMTPSWATDWSLSVNRATMPHDWDMFCYDQFDGAYDDFREVIASSSFYHADGGRPPQVAFLTDDSTKTLLLKCSGVCIGTVDGIANPFAVEGSRARIVVASQPSSTRNPYGDERAITRALIHTLFINPTWGDTVGASLFQIPWIADCEDPSDYFLPDGSINLTPTDIERYNELQKRGWSSAIGNAFFSFEFWRRGLSQFRIGGKRFQDYFVTDIVDCPFPPIRVRLDMATAVGAHASRCLVTLESGHFGLAPYTVERDDKVFVLQGCSLPVVLRPVGDTGQFKVVGECFVDGYWNGEAWDGVERGEFKVEDVVLC